MKKLRACEIGTCMDTMREIPKARNPGSLEDTIMRK